MERVCGGRGAEALASAGGGDGDELKQRGMGGDTREFGGVMKKQR